MFAKATARGSYRPGSLHVTTELFKPLDNYMPPRVVRQWSVHHVGNPTARSLHSRMYTVEGLLLHGRTVCEYVTATCPGMSDSYCAEGKWRHSVTALMGQ
jgi:hypothetical protein